jgi:hypothetical protein
MSLTFFVIPVKAGIQGTITKHLSHTFFVIPADAGIQRNLYKTHE